MKTYEQLKALKTEDFLAPNPVLCYGGGGAFESVAPIMAKCGINIVGVIDANKKGFAELNEKKIPFLSIEQAKEQYGSQINIFIMIANINIINEVEKNLIEAGFEEKHIFDMNAWQWLTVPSEKSYCSDMITFLGVAKNSLQVCCYPVDRFDYQIEYFTNPDGIKNNMQSYSYLRQHYIESIMQKNVPLYCNGCSLLRKYENQDNRKIKTIIFADHTVCNCDCAYCDHRCSVVRKPLGTTLEDRIVDFFEYISQLKKENIIDDNVNISIAGGEITVLPKKKIVYEFLRQMPNAHIDICTNGFIYDEEIANLLFKNKISELTCDFDAGTPETYIKIKGFNKYYDVLENLKKYSKFGKINVKYIIIPGVNDSDYDINGTVEIMKKLKLNTLFISPELDTYEKAKNDRIKLRELLFSTAKFLNIMNKNGIDVSFYYHHWFEKHVSIIRRLANELSTLDQVI